MDNDTAFYYSYGSNMSSKRILQSCPDAKFKGVAKLEDHEILFFGQKEEWAGAVANAVPRTGKFMWGVLWEIASAKISDLEGTESKPGDGFEHITQRSEVITDKGERIKCIFFRREYKGEETARPSPQYLQVILNGAEEHQIDQTYFEMLKQIKTNGNTVINEGMRKALY